MVIMNTGLMPKRKVTQELWSILKEPLNATLGIEGKYLDEGRLITLEYENFYFINTYVPNSQDELKRLDYRMEYNDSLKHILQN